MDDARPEEPRDDPPENATEEAPRPGDADRREPATSSPAEAPASQQSPAAQPTAAPAAQPTAASAATPASASGEEDREDDEERPIDADLLRVDPRVGREMFGDLFTDITARGPAQFGSNNAMHNYFGERPVDPVIEELPDLEMLLDVYAATEVDDQLDDVLDRRSTAGLIGPRNSGRHSTARAALARRYQGGHVYEIALPTGVSPEVLVHKPERLPEKSGFLMRLAGDSPVDTMRILGPLLRRRSATLLLIKDEESRRRELSGAEIQHRPPHPVTVFWKHLDSLLPDLGPEDRNRYRTNVEPALGMASSPKTSVALARAIAKEHPATTETLRGILDRTRSKLRARAFTILLPDAGGPPGRSRRNSQHERAFRLSYAVFHRRPLHYVFEAAAWLLREIDSAALRPDWGSMALQHPVPTLLGDSLRQDWEAGREASGATLGASRTAWLRDEGLRGAIIDVAWHEFDGTRKSLLNWLDRLVRDGDVVMRRAAAETAGLLVQHDFDRVYQDLVDVWAGDRRADVRQAAAWTMAYSDMAAGIGPRVRERLSKWSSGRNAFRQDTAARVYLSGMEQPVLAWSMLDLARIARERLQMRRYLVATAVAQLYRPERAGWILAEMDVWASNAPLQIHAARALLILATRSEANASDGRPELLVRLAEGRLDLPSFGRLWLVALLEPETEVAAAQALARWIRHADGNAEFRVHVLRVLHAIGATPARRRRVDFYLTKAFGHDHELPTWTREEGRRAS
ncbi:hypothetical protein ACFQS1_26530 [Paractinoplanes rhizophilus]|uniref:HEAT repeat protein n=1 Tax=Paractinoplanes rhizophilus TaxID=1416877 RepID=A0ABW2HXN5_9ACTN